MRVIAGSLAGRELAAPSGKDTRPTSALVRGAIFDVLAARAGMPGPPFPGWTVLDLFAGTGALGIEALSRGCAEAWLVESHPAALRALRRNVAALGLEPRAHVVASPVARFLRGGPLAPIRPRLILADPPYRIGAQATLAALEGAAGLAPDAWIVLQHAAGEELSARSGTLQCVWDRVYGVSRVSIFVPA